MIAFTWLMRILVLALLLGGVVSMLHRHDRELSSPGARHAAQ